MAVPMKQVVRVTVGALLLMLGCSACEVRGHDASSFTETVLRMADEVRGKSWRETEVRFGLKAPWVLAVVGAVGLDDANAPTIAAPAEAIEKIRALTSAKRGVQLVIEMRGEATEWRELDQDRVLVPSVFVVAGQEVERLRFRLIDRPGAVPELSDLRRAD